MPDGTVIVITGPIASGKSTIARELAGTIERRGVRVAVIDLDVVHDGLASGGATPGETTWAAARRAAADLAVADLAAGVAVVVAEGSFNAPADRATFADHLGGGTVPIYVSLRVSFEEAFRRAQADPSRGRSREPVFLKSHYTRVAQMLANGPASDLVFDTERQPASEIAATIERLVWSELPA
jgi:adenylylsulfate kinase-like enzyme